MQLANVGRTRLCCSVPVLLLVPLSIVFSKADTLLVCMLSLGMHELSHAFMAHRLGFRVDSVEIQPFGFVARLSGRMQSPAQAAAIAAAGPVVSLLLAVGSAGLRLIAVNSAPQLFRAMTAGAFTRFNLGVGLINLLPALPLDGGRLALALYEMRAGGRTRSGGANVLCALGVLAGAAIAAAGTASYAAVVVKARVKMPSAGEISCVITGAFIAAAAFSERKAAAGSGAAALLAGRSRLKRGESVRVNAVAMHESTTVADALRAAAGSGYAAVLVTDDELHALGIADEGMLLDAALRGRAAEKLGSILRSARKHTRMNTGG